MEPDLFRSKFKCTDIKFQDGEWEPPETTDKEKLKSTRSYRQRVQKSTPMNQGVRRIHN